MRFEDFKIDKMIFVAFLLLIVFPVAANAAKSSSGCGVSTNTILELDGTQAGAIKSFDIDVLSSQVGTVGGGNAVGKPRSGDITLNTFFSVMEPSFYKWVQDGINGKAPTMSGSIVEIDGCSNVFERYDFTDASIRKIVLPALDARSKDAINLTIILHPEYAMLNTSSSGTYYSYVATSGGQATSTSGGHGTSTSNSDKIFGNNFRLNITGLSTSDIMSIEGITIDYSLDAATGQYNGRYDFSDIIITKPDSSSQDWIDCAYDYLNGKNCVKSGGTLEFLNQAGETKFKLTFGRFTINDLSVKDGLIKAGMITDWRSFDYSAGSHTLGTVTPTSTPRVPASPKPLFVPKTTQSPTTLMLPRTTASPTIVTLQGKLSDSAGNPVQTGSMKVTIKDSSGAQVWQETFDNVIDNGVFNIPLGAIQELRLVPGSIYSMEVAINADSRKFVTASVTFGDNSPAGGVIKFKA